MKRRAERSPDQFEITERTMRQFARYKQEHANEVYIRIAEGVAESRDLVVFDIMLNVDFTMLPSVRNTELHLLEGWIYWPPTAKLDDTESRALLVHNLETLSPSGAEIDWIVLDEENPRSTSFYLKKPRIRRLPPNAQKDAPVAVRFKFECPSAFFGLGERPPYGRQDFSVGLRFPPYCAELTLVYFDYPNSITLRSRRDNGRYHSLTMGLDDDYERKTTYFEGPEVRMRCTFGSADAAELSAPLLPIFRAGLGVLLAAIGLMLLALNVGSPTIGSAFFALALAPWFFDVMQRHRLFSASVATKVSWTGISADCSLLIHALALLVAGVVLLRGIEQDWQVVSIFYMVTAGLILGVGLVLLTGLSHGVMLRYACDRCERRFPIRKVDRLYAGFMDLLETLKAERLLQAVGVWSHEASRRILCTRCWDEVANEDIVLRCVEEFINQKKHNIVGEIFSSAYTHHTRVPATPRDQATRERGSTSARGEREISVDEDGFICLGLSLGGIRRFVEDYRDAFPDFRIIVGDIQARGSEVITTYTFHGGFRRNLRRLQPNSREVTFTGTMKHRIEDGKIIEGWLDLDISDMRQHLRMAAR